MVSASRVTLPSVALEADGDIASYQASKLFGMEQPEALLIPVDKREDEVECLLLAIERDVLEDLKRMALSMGLSISGISLVTVAYAYCSEVKNGTVVTEWEEWLEAARVIEGKITDIFLIPKNNEKMLKAVAGDGDLIRISPQDLSMKDCRPRPLLKLEVKPPGKGRLMGKRAFIPLLYMLLALPLLPLYSRISSIKSDVNNLKREVERSRKKVQHLSSVKEKLTELRERLEKLKASTAGARPIELLYNLSRVMPRGTVIESLSLRGDSASITGYTEDVSALIKRLGNARFISDMKISGSPYLIKRGPYKGRYRFSITLRLGKKK